MLNGQKHLTDSCYFLHDEERTRKKKLSWKKRSENFDQAEMSLKINAASYSDLD